MNNDIQHVLDLLCSDQRLILGVLNVTPDSFSDGGDYERVDAAVKRALEMQREGADIIDIGGESTRPGARSVSLELELERVVPVIEAIRAKSDVAISIDTSKPAVMSAAVAAGAGLVNDVYALRAETAVECCAELNVPVCLMHMQGQPRTMQENPLYLDVVDDVCAFLRERAQLCVDAGIDADRILIDPGFGFGKTQQHNLCLLSRLDEISGLDFPVLVGLSRKSMLGVILDRPVNERLAGSLAAAVIAYQKGARLFRVHDVAETRDVLKVCEAVEAVNR